jgi:hypothetical protein
MNRLDLAPEPGKSDPDTLAASYQTYRCAHNFLEGPTSNLISRKPILPELATSPRGHRKEYVIRIPGGSCTISLIGLHVEIRDTQK